MEKTVDLKKLAKSTYPEYRGRKIRVETRREYQMMDYWSEGTRNFVKAVNLETGDVQWPTVAANIPWENPAHARFVIPQGWVLVEHAYFCGKSCGLTVICPAPLSIVSEAPKAALASEVR